MRRPEYSDADGNVASPVPPAQATRAHTRDAAWFLGVPVDRVSVAALCDAAVDAIEHCRAPPMVIACANPHSIVTAQQDEEFLRALSAADVVVADGVGVTIIGRCVGERVGPRITGTDCFMAIMQRLQERHDSRVFLFGSTERTLREMTERAARDFPAIEIVGTLSPPFGKWTADEDEAFVRRINAAAPHVLWVGMTAPKQEKWVLRNQARLDARVIGSIGAVFDFYAGRVARAPRWMQRTGAEWLYRLAREPRRLWRRNLISTPKFVVLALAERARRSASDRNLAG